MNISYYIELVKARLSDGIIHTADQTETQITSYLEGSVMRFNLFFNKTFDLADAEIYRFTDLIVQGAVITALASKALSECGREFSTEDAGVVFTPPAISSLLMQQWEAESMDYDRKLKFLLSKYDFSGYEPTSFPVS